MNIAKNIRDGKQKYESVYTGKDTFTILNMFAREQLLLSGEEAKSYVRQAMATVLPGGSYPPEYDVFFLWLSLIFEHFLEVEHRVVITEQRYVHIRLTLTELLASPIVRLSVLPSRTIEVNGINICVSSDSQHPTAWALFATLENKTSICIADVGSQEELDTLRFFTLWIVRNWQGQGDIVVELLP